VIKALLVLLAFLFITSCQGRIESTVADSTDVMTGAITKIESISPTMVRIFFRKVIDRDKIRVVSYHIYEKGNTEEPLMVVEPESLSLSEGSEEGIISVVVGALQPDKDYEFMIRILIEEGFANNLITVWEDIRTPRLSNSIALGELPSFSGIEQIINLNEQGVRIVWSNALDSKTPPEAMVYEIFRGVSLAGINFATPVGTVKGAIEYLDAEPIENSGSWYIVRAVDEDQNTDGNFKSLSVFRFPDLVFDGVIDTYSASHSQVNLILSPIVGGSGSLEYRFYLDGDITAPYSRLQSSQDDELEIASIEGLSKGTEYEVLVEAFDKVTEEKIQYTAVVETLKNAVATFDGIESIYPLPGLAGESALQISWNTATAPEGKSISGYQVYTSLTLPINPNT
jgi:hypothetical protein